MRRMVSWLPMAAIVNRNCSNVKQFVIATDYNCSPAMTKLKWCTSQYRASIWAPFYPNSRQQGESTLWRSLRTACFCWLLEYRPSCVPIRLILSVWQVTLLYDFLIFQFISICLQLMGIWDLPTEMVHQSNTIYRISLINIVFLKIIGITFWALSNNSFDGYLGHSDL